MAKKDELAFEGGVDTPQPNNNNSESPSSRNGQDRKKLWKRLYHENGR